MINKLAWKYRIMIAGGIVIAILGITFFMGTQYKYKYWHFFVHKKLYFFLDEDFRRVINKYGRQNVASFESKDGKGIIVFYPSTRLPGYLIQLRLEKNLKSQTFMFKAEIVGGVDGRHYDLGNPPIYMNIPMRYFDEVISKGLKSDSVEKMINIAQQVGWHPLGLNNPQQIKPPVILEYQ